MRRSRSISRTAAAALAVGVMLAPAAAGPDRSTANEAWRSFEERMREAGEAVGAGDLVAAEQAYLRAAEIAIGSGKEHLRYARALDGLADVHRLAERHRQAAVAYRESLTLFRRLLGAGQPRVATTMHNLATVLLAGGETDEAERLFVESRAIWESTLGENSIEVAVSLEASAALLQRTDRWEEAEPLIARAREIRDRAGEAAQ